jgi:amino acid adenylation domain-containing protein
MAFAHVTPPSAVEAALLEGFEPSGVGHDATAVTRGAQSLTYRDLVGASAAQAEVIGELPMVAVVARTSIAWPLALIAALRARVPFLPVDGWDVDGAARMLGTVRPGWLIAPPEDLGLWREAAGPVRSELPMQGEVVLLELAESRRGPRLPEDAAYLIPTSGTTGRPKTIVGSRRGLIHFMEWEIGLLSARERRPRVSQLTPPTFDPMLRDVLVPLASGGTLCLLPGQEVLLDPAALADWIASSGVNVMHCVPTLLRALSRSLGGSLPARLTDILVAGEPLYPADVRPWIEKCPAVRLRNLYGCSETTLAKFHHEVSGADLDCEQIPVGTCIPGSAAIVVDSELQPRPAASKGEILIRSPYRSHGYLDDEELTAERFISNPFTADPSDLVYKTGDIGLRHEDGVFELVGRVDDNVKVRGVSIALGSVESALRSSREVLECAVRPYRDPDGNSALCAYVVAAPNGLDARALRRGLARRLPAPMVPQRVVELERLPRTPHGKIDNAALAMLDVEPSPIAEPADPLARELLDLWREVLPGRPDIGVEHDFVLSGGQSIHAAQVVAHVRRHMAVELRVRDVFEFGTVRELAAAIQSGAVGRAAAEKPAPAAEHAGDEALPLTFAQSRFWRLREAADDSLLHFVWCARIDGSLDPNLLERCLRIVTLRHAAFRTRFEQRRGGGEVVQSLRGSGPPLRLERRAGEGRLAEQVVRWASRPFDLSTDLPLRALLVELGPREHALALCGHVIVSDGRSKEILLAELGKLYGAGGDATVLPATAARFEEHALRERGEAAERLFEERLARLRPRLPDEPRAPALAPSSGEAISDPDRGMWLDVTVGADCAAGLRAAASAFGSTEQALVFACFATAIRDWTGSREFFVMIPFQNRAEEFEGTAGCFTETALVLVPSKAAGGFEADLHRLSELFLRALDDVVPFDWFVRHMYPGRSSVDRQLFPFMFAPQLDLESAFSLPDAEVREIAVRLPKAVNTLHAFPIRHRDGLQVALNARADRVDRVRLDEFGELLDATFRRAAFGIRQPEVRR